MKLYRAIVQNARLLADPAFSELPVVPAGMTYNGAGPFGSFDEALTAFTLMVTE